MFGKIRREKQALFDDECREILAASGLGVLAVQGDGGYPYAVPLNYVYLDGSLYYHSATEGHKIDALRRDDRASFSVIGEMRPVTEKFSTHYTSVTVFGRVEFVTDEAERLRALTALTESLAGGESEESKRAEVESCTLREHVAVLALRPEHISGKRSLF